MSLEPWEAARAALPEGACVVGVDEVGRGPLAGDVVAAAVALQPGLAIEGMTDSKKLTARKREAIAEVLWGSGTPIALGRASPQEIDDLNILRASLLAMERALDILGVKPDLVLVDGRHLPVTAGPAYAVVRGDARVPEIAAASIVAKVQRDGEMDELHERWPAYGFNSHRGYPTRAHLEALAVHGVLNEHRRSFGPVRNLLEES